MHEIPVKCEVESLKNKLKTAEDVNIVMKNNYEEAIDDCESCYKRIKDLDIKIDRLNILLKFSRKTS